MQVFCFDWCQESGCYPCMFWSRLQTELFNFYLIGRSQTWLFDTSLAHEEFVHSFIHGYMENMQNSAQIETQARIVNEWIDRFVGPATFISGGPLKLQVCNVLQPDKFTVNTLPSLWTPPHLCFLVPVLTSFFFVSLLCRWIKPPHHLCSPLSLQHLHIYIPSCFMQICPST